MPPVGKGRRALCRRALGRYADAVCAVGTNPTSARKAQVRLGDVDPDSLRFIPDDERQQAAEVALPAVDLTPGAFAPSAVLAGAAGSCGVVLAGMVSRQIHLGDHVALRLLGPGAVIPGEDDISPDLIASSEWIAATPVRLAVLGAQFFRACVRWPHLQRNLISHFAEQNEQLAAQLALCQLPRVEDRLLAMLWLLAESWGKVTSSGTVVPVQLTHEALGAMVGARRPTVTLALGQLAESGAVVQRPDGWLLLEPPVQPGGEAPRIEPPQLVDLEPTVWSGDGGSPTDAEQRRRDLLALTARLREEHRQSVSEQQERLARIEAARARAYEIRDRLRQERRTGVGRSSPSEGDS